MTTECHGWLDEHAEGLRKPLYLQGQNNGLAVALDGPALRVRQPERATVFYPLARLARVISKGGVQWACEALLACADAGIPVVFLDGDGDVRGYLFGQATGAEGLYLRLQACLRQRNGLDRYRAWRQSMIVHARRALERQLAEQSGAAGTEWAQFRVQVLSIRSQVQPDGVVRRLRGLLAALSAQLWAEAGLDAARLLRLEALNLVDDLAELLGWALAAPVLRVLQRRARKEPAPDLEDDRQLTALFEAHWAELQRFGRILLERLQQDLEE